MRSTRISLGAILLITVVVGAGRASAAPPTACSLLTKEIAAEALDEAVRGPDEKVMGDVSSCEYSGSGLHKVHLNMMLLPKDQAQMYAGLCAQKSKSGLTGLGDVTCWYNDKHGELQVLKRTQFFSVELQRSGDPTEAIKRVAKRVYDKLP